MELYLFCHHTDTDSITSRLYGEEFCIEVVLVRILRGSRFWGVYRGLRCNVFTFLKLTMGWACS